MTLTVWLSLCVTVCPGSHHVRHGPRTPNLPCPTLQKHVYHFFFPKKKGTKKTNKLATYVKLWAHMPVQLPVTKRCTATAAIIHIYPYRSRSISITAAYYIYYWLYCTAYVRAEYVQETDACTYVRACATPRYIFTCSVHVPERTSVYNILRICFHMHACMHGTRSWFHTSMPAGLCSCFISYATTSFSIRTIQ